MVTRVGQAATTGRGGMWGRALWRPCGPASRNRSGELVPLVCKCGRCRRLPLVAQQGQQVSRTPPWGRGAEPEGADVGARRLGLCQHPHPPFLSLPGTPSPLPLSKLRPVLACSGKLAALLYFIPGTVLPVAPCLFLHVALFEVCSGCSVSTESHTFFPVLHW